MTVFLRDFDDEAQRRAAEAERARRATITPEELEQALAEARAAAFEEGRAAGHAAGRAEAMAEDTARRTEALLAVRGQMDDILGHAARHRRALEAQALDFAMSVCEKVFPEVIAERGRDRAASAVRRTLRLALGSARLRIRLSPADEAALRPALEQDARLALPGVRAEILRDETLEAGAVRVEWDNGFMEQSFAATCRQILSALARSRAEFGPHAAPMKGEAHG